MTRRLLPALLSVALAVAACADGAETPTSSTTTTTAPPASTTTTAPIEGIHLRWDLSETAEEWTVGFADYSTVHEPMDLDSGVRPLPEGHDGQGEALMVSGANTSDDLFMFVSREVGPESGIEPDTTYEAVLRVHVASGAPSDCVGIGGAPGESVFMKAGVVETEPTVSLTGDDYRLDLDKGNQASGGSDLEVVGNIANGLPCGESLAADPVPFVDLTFDTRTEVTSDAEGRIWVIVGTDSGFEGTTTLYYRSIELNLLPS